MMEYRDHSMRTAHIMKVLAAFENNVRLFLCQKKKDVITRVLAHVILPSAKRFVQYSGMER